MKYKSICDVQSYLFRKKLITKQEIYEFWKEKKDGKEAFDYLKILFK